MVKLFRIIQLTSPIMNNSDLQELHFEESDQTINIFCVSVHAGVL